MLFPSISRRDTHATQHDTYIYTMCPTNQVGEHMAVECDGLCQSLEWYFVLVTGRFGSLSQLFNYWPLIFRQLLQIWNSAPLFYVE